eukprot:3063231-Rhodomonas_salina.1
MRLLPAFGSGRKTGANVRTAHRGWTDSGALPATRKMMSITNPMPSGTRKALESERSTSTSP